MVFMVLQLLDFWFIPEPFSRTSSPCPEREMRAQRTLFEGTTTRPCQIIHRDARLLAHRGRDLAWKVSLFFEEIRVLANAKTHAGNQVSIPALRKNCLIFGSVFYGAQGLIGKCGVTLTNESSRNKAGQVP
jgi:hypothetical protein